MLYEDTAQILPPHLASLGVGLALREDSHTLHSIVKQHILIGKAF